MKDITFFLGAHGTAETIIFVAPMRKPLILTADRIMYVIEVTLGEEQVT